MREVKVTGRAALSAGRPGAPGRAVLESRPEAAVRLYLLPPAGSGPECFLRWVRLVPECIEPCSVTLPGRGGRARQASVTDPDLLAEGLAAVLDDAADRRPFALFGHSAGALMAYTATCRLRRTGRRMPGLLALSSLTPPHLGDYRGGAAVRAAAGAEGLVELAGPIPRRVLRDGELLAALYAPVLADCLLFMQYHHVEEPLLQVPLALFGGLRDPVVGHAGLVAWNDLFTHPADPIMLPGAHTWPFTRTADLIGHLCDALDGALSSGRTP